MEAKLLELLKKVGISEEKARIQIKELDNLIFASVVGRIVADNPDIKLDESNIQSFIKEKYTNEEIVKMTSEEGKAIFTNFLDIATKSLGEKTKEDFYNELFGTLETSKL
jgi:hypothetical protein